MNKIITIIGLWVGLLLCGGCEGPAVGYLITESVAYPIDSMVILSRTGLEQQMVDLEAKKADFDNSEEGKAYYARLAELQEELAGVLADIQLTKDQIYNIDIQLENPSLSDEAREALKTQRETLRKYMIHTQEGQRDLVKEKIEVLNSGLGGEMANITEQIEAIQRRIEKHTPWTTSAVDGVLGTDPIYYRIHEVKSTDGDVAAFMKYLSVMGGGRLVVTWEDEQVPSGRYVVSIEISNEGYTKIVEDAFTFIVE